MTLPAGTITFVFSDIEGSTPLWDQHPQQMELAHARHSELIVSCIEQLGGKFVRKRGEGDSTFSVFNNAADALAATCAFQRALHAETWPAETPIRVRAALHTGTAKLRHRDYNSSDVNRCARLRAIAHGGQTLVSRTVYDLVRDALPEGVSLRDMGLHQLKGLSRPEQVYQLLHPDLPSEFPPLQSQQIRRTNLPIPLTSFIGREEEMVEIRRLLATARLLTLTGIGGCGKTRLALQMADELVEEYADGAWLVDLAAVSDEGLVPQTVAQVLGLREAPGSSLIQTLEGHLKSKKLLLVLDNCEHLLTICGQLADRLLRACPTLRILATSREGLGIAGEHIYQVPSLALPDPAQIQPLEALSEYEAVRLFVVRAGVNPPGFRLTQENAPAVIQICRRLDGIPLAIELAAARANVLSPQQIVARLDHRFRLLTGGSQTAMRRQQTLRALLDWSYDLLARADRTLFRRLAVFAGGWTLEAAEQVTGDRLQGTEKQGTAKATHSDTLHPDEILDLLAHLVSKSLVMVEDQGDERRYRLLETVREYSLEKLIEAGEAEALRERHRDYFLNLAEEDAPETDAPEPPQWLASMEMEHDNLRLALSWCLETGERGKEKGEREEDQSKIENRKSKIEEAGLRLAGTLSRFWHVRGYWSEGRRWLARMLDQGATVRGALRAKALTGAAHLALSQGDLAAAQSLLEENLQLWRGEPETPDTQRRIAGTLQTLAIVARARGRPEEARSLLEESLAIRKEIDDKVGLANVSLWLGHLARDRQDYPTARTLYTQSLAIYQERGHDAYTANALHSLGLVAQEMGDYVTARSYYEQNLSIRIKLGDKSGLARTLDNLGNIARDMGDFAAARQAHEESLAIKRKLEDERGIADSQCNLGWVLALMGDYAQAETLLLESVRRYRRFENQVDIPECLEGLASAAYGQGQVARSARLLGAAHALRLSLLAPLTRERQGEHEQQVAAVRSTLSEDEFSEEWKRGEEMGVEVA